MVKVFDGYGIKPDLYVSNSPKFKTTLGGVVTIILFITTFASSVYFGKELFQKESPSVNFSSECEMHPKRLLYFDEFEFIFTLQDMNDRPYINSSIYYPQGVLIRTVKDENGLSANKMIYFNFTKCSESPPKSTLFKDFDLDLYYCVSRNQSLKPSEFYIQEYWGNVNFQLIQVQLIPCNKGDNNSHCADDETIDKYLRTTKITIYMTETLVKTRKFKNPIEKTLKEYYFYVSKNSFLSVTQYLKSIRIESDSGLLFASLTSQTSFGLEKTQQYSLPENSRKQFVNFNIQFSNISSVYFRRYDKLQDFIAQIGGIFKILVTFGHFIVAVLTRNSYQEYLLRNFFVLRDERYFRISEKNFLGQSKKPSNSYLRISIPQINRSVDPFQRFKKPIKVLKTKGEHWTKIKGIKKCLPVPLLIKITRKSERYSQFRRGVQIIYEYLNIICLLRTLHDSKQIKEFLVRKNPTLELKSPNFALLNRSLFIESILKKISLSQESSFEFSLKSELSK